MLQNLLKVFNGYWRMDFPDWGQYKLGLSSRLFFHHHLIFMIWKPAFFLQLICLNLKPPSWQYLCAVKRNICVFSFFPLDSKNRHFARLQRERETAISENAAIPHFLRKKKSQNRSWWLGGWGGQSESAFISLELKIAILLLLTFQHWSVFSWKTSKIPRKT